jgi:hypothetical protein
MEHLNALQQIGILQDKPISYSWLIIPGLYPGDRDSNSRIGSKINDMNKTVEQKIEDHRNKRRAIMYYMYNNRNVKTIEHFACLFNIFDKEELMKYKVEFNLV